MRSKQYKSNLPSNDWFNFTTRDNDNGSYETPAVSMNLSHLFSKSASPPQEEEEETHLMNQKWTCKRISITSAITLALVGSLIGGIMAGLSSRTNHNDHQTIHNNIKCQAPISYLGNGKCDVMYNTTECNFDQGDCLPSLKYPNCTVDNLSWIQDGYCDGYPYNSLECGYDGGDCLIKDYPHCINIEEFDWLGDGQCDEKYNTKECGYDLGDCSEFNALYPDCTVDNVRLVGDGYCNGGAFNVEECGFDGGDCIEFNQKYGSDCNVEFPYFLADDECDGGAYNTLECNWDGGDCIEFNTQYRNCIVDDPYLVGNDVCDGPLYNTTECKFDGGDCIGDVNTGVVDDDDNFNDVADDVGRRMRQNQAHENQDAESQMKKKWEDLKNSERKIIAQQQIWDTDAIQATEELAEQTLEAALEFVQMQEQIEAKHTEAVHSDFERAFQEENVLREFLAENSMTEEADSFLEDRLEAAELVEIHAVEEAKDSLHHLAELYNQEDVLKEALKELNSLKKWEGMKSVDDLYHSHNEQVTQSLEQLKDRKKDADEKLSKIEMLHKVEESIENMYLEDGSDVARVAEDLCEGIIQAALYFVNMQDEKVGERLVDKTIRILQDQKDDIKEEILTAALEYIRNVEHVEELHVHLAHRLFEEAMQEDQIFENLMTSKYKDFMRPSSFHELEYHLTDVHEEEVQAIREEANALRQLGLLCSEEEFIKALLEEIEKRNANEIRNRKTKKEKDDEEFWEHMKWNLS